MTACKIETCQERERRNVKQTGYDNLPFLYNMHVCVCVCYDCVAKWLKHLTAN